VINPAASSVSDRVRAGIEQRLAAADDLIITSTEARGHASRLAADAARDGLDAVFVLGGDGTLNEAAAGLAGSATALAALPGGSTNVFARTLGVPYDPLDATDRLLAGFRRGQCRRIGLGRANGRCFLFHLGAGFDAAVVSEVELRPRVKRHHLAHPAFAVAALDTWVRRFDHRTRIRAEVVAFDGDRAECAGEGPYVVVSNSSPYTYLGRQALVVARQASLDRALALTVVRSLDATVMLRATAAAMGWGGFLNRSRHVAQRADLVGVTLHADLPFPWQVDGDYLGETDALEVRYEPDALMVVVPAR
jgi:diacylglycerol kinase family enzyme